MVPDLLADALLPDLRAIHPAVACLPVAGDGRWSGDAAAVEVLLRFFPNDRYPGRVFGADAVRAVLRAAPALRWIHNGTTGVEGVLVPELVDRAVVLTNGAGAHRRAIAETVLGSMLAHTKALPAHLREQAARRWTHQPHTELRGQTAAVLGLGAVGREIALLCAALGMRVVGTRRHADREPPSGVAQVFGPDRQRECVAEADFVVVAAPLTPATRGMVDASTLAAMRPEAVLINVARGALVDEAALLAALRGGAIAAAYLDVFATEPLPPDSPFFALPNVVVTPHNAGWSAHVVEQALEIFFDNFRRFCEGRPLRNVVDKRAGY